MPENIQIFRMISFFALLALFLGLEYIRPSFPNQGYKKHLKVNLTLFITSIIILKIAFPFGLYSLASQISLNQSSVLKIDQLPWWISFVLTILIFDLAIYWQHRLFHVIPFFWRAHKVHHSDQQMDVTTAVRFHPVEIFLSGIYKIIIMLLLGPQAEAYLVYEILLNGFALFTHGNFHISPQIDKIVRIFFVTPAMHYPHHSPNKRLTNMNYGNILSLWDRLFKSYTEESNDKFGLDNVTAQQAQSINDQMKMAFHK